MEIVFLPYIHYLGFLICVFLIFYILYSNFRDLLSVITVFFIACFAFWCLGKIFIHNPATPKENVDFWYNVISIGWLWFSYFFLLFSLLYSFPRKFYKYKWFLLALAILPLALVVKKWQGDLMAEYVRNPYGWNFVWEKSVWTYLFYVYYTVFVLSSFYILTKYARETKFKVRKKQVRIIVATAAIALSLGSITDIILTKIEFLYVPSLGNVLSMLWVCGVAYSIIRYNFLSITPKRAAENIISTMSDGLILVNAGGEIKYVNEKILNLTGFYKKELNGKNINYLFKKDTLAKDLAASFNKKELLKNYETVLKSKGKKRNIPVVFSGSDFTDEEGGLAGFVCIVKDITEIRKTEDKLEKKNEELKENMKKIEESKEKLAKFVKDLEKEKKNSEKEKEKTSSIIASFNDPIIFIDNSNKIQLFNEAAVENLGLTGEVLGKKVKKDNNYSIENFKKFIKYPFEVKNRLVSGEKESFEEMVLSTDESDKKKYYKIITVKVCENKNNCFGHVKVFNDLTREKEIDKIKTHFITIAAHQLRTPLSAIKWSIKMILDGDAGKVNEEQNEILAKTYDSNERIIRLVNDLLNVSRIEEGKFNYDFKKSDLGKIVDEVVKREATLISGKKFNIEVEKPDKLPKVYVDKDKIQLALENIITNAIKYSDKAKDILVILENDGGEVKVKIEDGGMGIPKDELDDLFDKFYRASNAKKTEVKGSGLGLYIVKNIIDKHGGDIEVESEVGKGTTIIFTVPTKVNRS